MAWVRVGDEAMSHPKLMGVYDVEDRGDVSLSEVFTLLMGLACYSAKHLTDGVVERGAVYRSAEERGRAAKVVDVCVAAGLMSWVDVDGVRKLRLFQDEEFIHIQTREEVERRRARARDNSSADFKAAVIFRDGDHCRYCGRVVRWTGPQGYGMGTLDHLDPSSVGMVRVEGLVVCCWECNSARKAARKTWDEENPLLPIPTDPFYGEWSRAFLQRRGYPVGGARPTAASAGDASDAPSVGAVPGASGTTAAAGGGSVQSSREEVDPGAPSGPRPPGPRGGGGAYGVPAGGGPRAPPGGPRPRVPWRPTPLRLISAGPRVPPGLTPARPLGARPRVPPLVTPLPSPPQATATSRSPDVVRTGFGLRTIRSLFASGREGTGRDGQTRQGQGREGQGLAGKGRPRAGTSREGPEGAPSPPGNTSTAGSGEGDDNHVNEMDG